MPRLWELAILQQIREHLWLSIAWVWYKPGTNLVVKFCSVCMARRFWWFAVRFEVWLSCMKAKGLTQSHALATTIPPQLARAVSEATHPIQTTFEGPALYQLEVSACLACQGVTLCSLTCGIQWGLDDWDTPCAESSVPLTSEFHLWVGYYTVLWILVPSRPSHLHKNPIIYRPTYRVFTVPMTAHDR